MVPQRLEIAQRLLVLALQVLDVGIVVFGLVLILAFVERGHLEQRQRLVEFVQLEIGIRHVELHLLGLRLGEGGRWGLLVDGQGVGILLPVEEHVGIKELSMARPGAAGMVVDKGLDLGFRIGLSGIQGTHRDVVLGIHRLLEFFVFDGVQVLGKGLQRSPVFLVPE